jgi:GTP cyclohydrolase III
MFRITRNEEIAMIARLTLIAIASCIVVGAKAQDAVTLKSAVVALSAQPELRAEFEEGLVRKARQLQYNAVPSFDLVPDVTDVDDRDFIKRMLTNGVGAVLMVRPAAVGPGASLESVKEAVSPSVYESMRAFGGELSRSGQQEILAVVHLAIYLISIDGAELIGSGAVWLDEPSPTREEAIERLQNLIVANVNGVRPAIRDHLGLAPLE